MYCKNCGRQVPDQSELCTPCKAAMFDRFRAKYAQAVPNEAPVAPVTPAETPVVPVETVVPVAEAPAPVAPVETVAPVAEETVPVAPAEEAPAAVAPREEEGETAVPMREGELGNAFALDIPAREEGKEEETPAVAAEEAFGKDDGTTFVAENTVAPVPAPVPVLRTEDLGKKPKKPVMRGFGKALAASILVEFGVGYAIVAMVYAMLYFIAKSYGGVDLDGLPLDVIATLVAVITVLALGFSVPTLIFSVQSIRLFLRAKKEEPRPLPYPAFIMGIYSLVGSAIALVCCLLAAVWLLAAL